MEMQDIRKKLHAIYVNSSKHSRRCVRKKYQQIRLILGEDIHMHEIVGMET
jgi:hypothetical protein